MTIRPLARNVHIRGQMSSSALFTWLTHTNSTSK